MNWEASELLWWQVFYSIDDNKDKPIMAKVNRNLVTEEDSIKALMGVFK